MIQYNPEQVYPRLCTVLELPVHGFVYPIFKNASSSLDQIAVNKHVVNRSFNKSTELVTVFWREAQTRFNSGVNTYIELNQQLDEDTLVSLIERGELVDRHFMPQYMWLCHLYKNYTGQIHILSLEDLKISVHKNASTRYYDYVAPTHWINLDNIIYKKFVNTTTNLNEINQYIKDTQKVLYKKCIAQD